MGIDNLRHTNRANKKTDAKKLDLYIERIANYDKDALAALYHMTSASVYSFALSLLKNIQDAEDVLHDTYLQVYKTAASYKSMDKLTDEERQIIMLHTVSGYKHREVAGFLKIPLSTALSKYHRAIKKLRILLSEEN